MIRYTTLFLVREEVVEWFISFKYLARVSHKFSLPLPSGNGGEEARGKKGLLGRSAMKLRSSRIPLTLRFFFPGFTGGLVMLHSSLQKFSSPSLLLLPLLLLFLPLSNLFPVPRTSQKSVVLATKGSRKKRRENVSQQVVKTDIFCTRKELFKTR